MKRILIVCEGHTEKTFVEKTLCSSFINKGISLQAPLIKKSRGGIVKWQALKKQIKNHLKEPVAYVSTFIDYYGLSAKHEFPAWEETNKIQDKNSRMDCLEQAMSEDIGNRRFIPYVQLHEFEGLLFNDIDVIKSQISPKGLDIKKLNNVFTNYPNPEMINDGKETSPSHRLKQIIKGYDKIVHGNIIAEAIGLERMREKSPRFNEWISKLEKC